MIMLAKAKNRGRFMVRSSGFAAAVVALAAGCSGVPGQPQGAHASLCVDAPGRPPCPASIDSPKPKHIEPCDDPLQQLPCYCTSHGLPSGVASSDNLVAPCYPSSVQTPTSLLLGLFSAYSWTASSWPVSSTREPDFTVKLGDRKDNATVWETWKTSTDVFLPDGGAPPNATSQRRLLPRSCRAIDVKAARAKFAGWEKVPAELPPRYLPNYRINEMRDYVVARDGQPLRVEIVMNPPAFDYIYEHRLYNEDGQRAFLDGGGKIEFPMGQFAKDTRGAHFVKAAWKILGPGDDLDEYHKSWAYVDTWFENGEKVEDCRLAIVGLVGLHLTSKLDQAPTWSWATFEHAKNAPLKSEVAGAKEGQYLFFNPGCAPPRCADINTNPQLFPPGGTHPQLSNLVMEQTYGEGEQHNTPNDVGSTVWVNAQLEKLLAKSVFRNYKLKGTQWFDQPIVGEGSATPKVLANTLLEAYFQNNSTCLGCHRSAGLSAPSLDGERGKERFPSDFVFVLHEAKPELHIE